MEPNDTFIPAAFPVACLGFLARTSQRRKRSESSKYSLGSRAVGSPRNRNPFPFGWRAIDRSFDRRWPSSTRSSAGYARITPREGFFRYRVASLRGAAIAGEYGIGLQVRRASSPYRRSDLEQTCDRRRRVQLPRRAQRIPWGSTTELTALSGSSR